MRLAHRRFAFLLTGLLIACVTVVASGCARDKTEEPTPNIIQYTVRGVVMQLPADDRPASEFVVRHEPVPSYMMGGKVVGMKSMQMPFPLMDGLTVSELKIGQPIELSFEVEYNEAGSPVNVHAVSIELLPADTVLHFE